MNKLLDLRFVIGLFFLATGSLLVGHYVIVGKSQGDYPTINLWSGMGFLLFGVFMVLLSLRKEEEE